MGETIRLRKKVISTCVCWSRNISRGDYYDLGNYSCLQKWKASVLRHITQFKFQEQTSIHTEKNMCSENC